MTRHTLSSTAMRSYWLGRYLERAENTARLVTVTANLLYDLPRRLPLIWRALVDITGGQTLYDELYDDPTERRVVRFLINDVHNPASLANSLVMARENARTLRGIIPRDTVEYVNELHLYAKDRLAEPLSRSRRTEGLAEVTEQVQKIDGFMSTTMLHDDHWRFFRMGNFIERADMTSRIVEIGANDLFTGATELEPFHDNLWRSVLRALNATQPYTAVVQEPINQAAVQGFLLQHAELPRSLTYAVNSLASNVRGLPRHGPILRKINKLRRFIADVDAGGLTGTDLEQFVDDCQIGLDGVHAAVHRIYFEGKAGGASRQRSRTGAQRQATTT